MSDQQLTTDQQPETKQTIGLTDKQWNNGTCRCRSYIAAASVD